MEFGGDKTDDEMYEIDGNFDVYIYDQLYIPVKNLIKMNDSNQELALS